MTTAESESLQAHLLVLPSELLIQDILSNLPIPTLIACSQTCKFLNSLIASSSLLTYLKELTIAGMLDNPLCAYTSYPISKRLDMLRERERRWLALDPKWKRQVGMSPPRDRPHLFDIAPGHALFGITKFDIAGTVTSLKLPNELEGEVHWEEVASLGLHVINFGVALQEHKLIACLAYTNNPTNPNSFQVHLINHSTAEHHPSACVPIISVHTPHLQPGNSWGDIAVCGENLAVSVKYPITTDHTFAYRLYIWNWKSGVLKAEFELDAGCYLSPELRAPGLTFLREDILLNPNAVVNSLDVYHIPSSPLGPSSFVCVIARFNLPRLAKPPQQYFIQSHLSPSPRSSSALHNIPIEKPFINDPEQSILGLVLDFCNDERWVYLSLLVRWQYLLDCCLSHLASINNDHKSDTPYHIYPWEEWGPKNSRLIPLPCHPPLIMRTTGSRWVTLVENTDRSGRALQVNAPCKIEVYDFDKIRTRIAGQQAVTVKHKGRSIRVLQIKPNEDNNNGANACCLVELVDATSPSVYPTSNGIFAQKVYTYLPYLRTTYTKPDFGIGQFKKKQKKLAEWMKNMFRHRRGSASRSLGGSDAKVSAGNTRPDLCQWHGLFVDDERIVGLTYEWAGLGELRCRELDILYMG